MKVNANEAADNRDGAIMGCQILDTYVPESSRRHAPILVEWQQESPGEEGFAKPTIQEELSECEA